MILGVAPVSILGRPSQLLLYCFAEEGLEAESCMPGRDIKEGWFSHRLRYHAQDLLEVIVKSEIKGRPELGALWYC